MPLSCTNFSKLDIVISDETLNLKEKWYTCSWMFVLVWTFSKVNEEIFKILYIQFGKCCRVHIF